MHAVYAKHVIEERTQHRKQKAGCNPAERRALVLLVEKGMERGKKRQHDVRHDNPNLQDAVRGDVIVPLTYQCSSTESTLIVAGEKQRVTGSQRYLALIRGF